METLAKDSTSTPSTFAERAAALQKRGFSLIPLASRGKQPVAGLGVRSRTKDPERIAQWAEQFPDANVGVCADDTFIILDADNAEEMLKVTGQLNTYTVESSPGKAHYYFRRDPQGFNYVRNLELGKLGSLRAENMYVVGEGSIHPKTGLPYRCVNDAPVAIIHPEVFHKLQQAAEEAEREVRKIVADWDGIASIPEGTRQTILKHLAGKWHDGLTSEEELFEKLMVVNAKCVPPKPASEILRLAKWALTKEPNKPQVKLEFGTPRVVRDREEFVMEPIGRFDCWFPLGQVSMIYGASAAGKSTLALQIMEQVAQGGEFLMHQTRARKIVIIALDRNARSMDQTFLRMSIPNGLFHVETLPEDVWADANLTAPAVNRVIEQHGPEVVLLEGLDTRCTDQTQKGVVPFMRQFQRIAEHHSVAVIGTWGAPKRQSTREAYGNARDAASGSGMVSRMAATMVYVREDEQGVRHVTCGHRDCAGEKYAMRFKDDGRLHLYVASDIPDPMADDPLDALVRQFPWEKVEPLKVMSKASYYRRKQAVA
jgi:Bifunctional DNA primase/polymerase, N-terminal/AAA domain